MLMATLSAPPTSNLAIMWNTRFISFMQKYDMLPMRGYATRGKW
jgi:hypothetical protein